MKYILDEDAVAHYATVAADRVTTCLFYDDLIDPNNHEAAWKLVYEFAYDAIVGYVAHASLPPRTEEPRDDSIPF